MSGHAAALPWQRMFRAGRAHAPYFAAAGIVVFGAAVVWIGWRDIGEAALAVSLPFVAALMAVEVVALILRVWKWRIVLGANENAARLAFLSKAGGNLSPGRIGEFAPLAARQYRTARLGSWILADRILEMAATLLLGMIGFVVWSGAGHATMAAWTAVLLAGVVTGTGVLAHPRIATSIAARLPLGRIHNCFAITHTIGAELRSLGPKLPVLSALTLLAKALDLVVGLLLYAALGAWVPLALLAAAQCVHALASALPFAPNATGIPYVAAAAFLHETAGVSPEILAAAVAVRYVAGNLVFWGAFAAVVIPLRRAAAFRDQGELFDHLSGEGVLYAYTDDSLRKLRALRPQPGRALDVGCGDGAISAALGAPAMFSFDLSARCAKLAHAKGVTAAVADARRGLPYANESFDTVYCIDVLHHMHDAWSALFPELARVLRPGGALVIVEPDARNPFVRWTQAPRSPIRVAPWHDEPAIEPLELAARLITLGFTPIIEPIQIEGAQQIRSVFPLWQRLLKAPFVMALAWACRNRPNKFAMLARKPV